MRIWRGIKNHFVPTKDNAYRPRLLRRPWLLFFLALTLGTEGFLVSNLVARQTDQNFLAAVVPAEVIALTNTEREANDAGDVSENDLLQRAAQAKAQDMAANGYFSHVGPDGKTPWKWISDSGYKYQYAGENLAVRFIDSKDVVNAWMQSPTHRENIVKPVYTEIGIGVAQGMYEGEPATYVVQYFASPLSAAVAAAATPTASQPTAVRVATSPTPTAPAPAITPTPSPTAPALPTEVAGASTGPQSSFINNVTQNVQKFLTRVFANPQRSTSWVLGTIATLLTIILILTFFVHVQVQPTNMLLNGAMVAVLAMSLIAVNSRLAEGGSNADSQTAGVIESTKLVTVQIGNSAESTGFSFFPQSQ